MDRHKTMENYGKAKAAVFRNQTPEQYCVINHDDEECMKLAKDCRAKVVPFSRKTTLDFGVYVDVYKRQSIEVAGQTIHCWRSENPHGTQTLKQAVGNSCNPVFVQLATEIGIEKFYDYMATFGITGKTGIDFPGRCV